MQVVPTGWPVFSLAWNSKHFVLVAGGNGVLHIFKVDMEEARKLRHARQVTHPIVNTFAKSCQIMQHS